MGPFTPEALGGYKYVSKISDEHTRWTEIYLLKSKDGALHAFQSFVHSMVISSGVRVERLRADKGGEFIGNDFKDYCAQTGVLLEYASTNTPQQIGMSERVGGTLAAMVRCMLAGSGLPMFLWGELMFTAAYVGNRAPHSALNMQSPYKMLKGTEPDLRRFFPSSGRGPLCTLRDVPKSSHSRQLKGDWLGTAATARAIACTIRSPDASSKEGTSPLSRRRRAYFRHLQRGLDF